MKTGLLAAALVAAIVTMANRRDSPGPPPFGDSDTERLFLEERCRHFPAIARVALRKLIQLNRARTLHDLAVPPGNRLEALVGDLAGFLSIRVNAQWRIIFRWTNQGPSEVAIVDYH